MTTTIGQGWIFLGCLLAGFVIGLVYEAGYILRFCFAALFKESKPKTVKTPKKRKHFNFDNLPSFIFTIVIDIIFFGVCLVLVLTAAKITADGQIFWFSVAAFVSGFIFERISLGIIVAKSSKLIYNTLAKAMASLKKLKFFGKLFR